MSLPFENSINFELLKNEAEALVLHELEVQLDAHEGEICRCDDCVMDMAAMALNAVKPMYRYSLMGSIYAAHAMNEKSYADSVQQAVSQAIAKVSTNPGHE
jgi:competence protein ComFB